MMTEPASSEISAVNDTSGRRTGMPRWVKVFLIVAAVVVVVMVALMIVTGGQHGPGRHHASSAGGDGSRLGATATAAPLAST